MLATQYVTASTGLDSRFSSLPSHTRDFGQVSPAALAQTCTCTIVISHSCLGAVTSGSQVLPCLTLQCKLFFGMCSDVHIVLLCKFSTPECLWTVWL